VAPEEVYRCRDPEGMVYRPSNDSFLLANTVLADMGALRGAGVVLDLGTGSGYIAKEIGRALLEEVAWASIVAIDISPCAVQAARDALRASGVEAMVIQCDGATCLRKGSVGLAVVNPPYLPVDEREDWLGFSWSGGYRGVSTALKFLRDLIGVVRSGGAIYMVLSSLGDLEYFEAGASEMGYRLEAVAKAKLFYEELVVYRIYRPPDKGL